jgi:uncharacterized RDD family membrane protein YckC
MLRRCIAFHIDQTVGFLLSSLFFIFDFVSNIFLTGPEIGLSQGGITVVLFPLIGYVFYMLLRDLYQGRSVGKRICNLVVIDSNDGKVASAVQSVVRNITILIWPVEIIFLIFRKDGRRIGDHLAKSTVVAYHQDIVQREDKRQFWWLLLTSLVVLSVMLYSRRYFAPTISEKDYLKMEVFDSITTERVDTMLKNRLNTEVKSVEVKAYYSNSMPSFKYFKLYISLNSYDQFENEIDSIKIIINDLLREEFGANQYKGVCKMVFVSNTTTAMAQVWLP